MCRSFLPEPLPEGLLPRLLDQARRAPSAGNTQAVEFCVVQHPEHYWGLTLPPERRAGFPWPGLLAAPVLVVVLTEPDRYVRRYAEADKTGPDKSGPALGRSEAEWPVPYWWVDAGMAVHSLLVGASAAGLGSCFFGAFEHEAAVLEGLGLPAGRRVVGTVALGYPSTTAGSTTSDRPSSSAARPRRPLDEIIRYPRRSRPCDEAIKYRWAMSTPDPVDRLAIEDVIVRYTVAIDEKDWDLLDTVFTPDAQLDYSSSAPGVDEANADYPTVKKWLQGALSIFPMTQHMVGKTYIRSWDGDTAQCSTIFHNPMGMPINDKGAYDPDGSGQHIFTVGGWYHDTVTRTPDGFRISLKVEATGYMDGGFPDGFTIPE